MGQPRVPHQSRMPQGRLARRVHASVNAAQEHVCRLLGRSSLGARSVWLTQTSCVRGELGHRPGLWLRFASYRRVWQTPAACSPHCPPRSRPELCREERGSLLRVPSPPPPCPGGKDAAQGSRARCAGSCHAAQPPRLLFLQARQRDQALPVRWQHLADRRQAVGSGASRGGGTGTQTSSTMLSAGKGSLTGHSNALWMGSASQRTWSDKARQELADACRSGPDSCHKCVLPAGWVGHGVGTGGGRAWQRHVRTKPEHGTAAVRVSASSPTNAHCWSWEACAGQGYGQDCITAGQLRAETLPMSPPMRLASFAPASEAAATRAKRSRAGPGLRPRQPCCPQVLSSHPLSLQVNNATARVMTNKKAANPYTNGKGQHEESRSCGGPGHPWAPLLPGCH